MDKVKRAPKVETPKQPSLDLKLGAPEFYPTKNFFSKGSYLTNIDKYAVNGYIFLNSAKLCFISTPFISNHLR